MSVEQFDEIIAAAEKEKLSGLALLERFLSPPARLRKERSVERRIQTASFPTDACFENFDWKFNQRTIQQTDFEQLGTGDFVESSSTEDMQDYTWGDPGTGLRALGFAAVNKVLPMTMWVYLVADDGANEPVFAVSDFTIADNRSTTAVESRTWGWVKGEMQ